MRAALVGSVPNVTVTFMPGFKSAAVAFTPFTVISVNCVIPSVFAFLSSATVDRKLKPAQSYLTL